MKKTGYVWAFILFVWHAPQAFSQLIAHYPLTTNASDVTHQQSDIRLINASFKEGAVFCEGSYGDYEKNEGTMITTPSLKNINFDKITISVDFKAIAYENMPVFVLGRSCRLLNFLLKNDGTIELKVNNGEIVKLTPLSYTLNTWHTATITYNKATSTAILYLDGQKGALTQASFSSECMTQWSYSNGDVSTTNFSNGQCFKGFWRNVKVYNEVVPPSSGTSIRTEEKPVITWTNPANNNLKVTAPNYTLRACVQSMEQITQIKLYVNKTEIPDSQDKRHLINEKAHCNYTYEKPLQLKSGLNEITLKVSNSSGTVAATTHIFYQASVAIASTTPINQKIQKTILDVGSYQPYTHTSSYDYYGVLMAPRPGGGAYISWKDTQGNHHVTQITEQARKVNDVIVAGKNAILYAITGDSNGFAVLISRTPGKLMWGYVIKYTDAGSKVFEKKIIGDDNFDKEGNRDFSDWATPRIGFSGTDYAVYFANHRKWGDGVVHQGDIFILLDKNGNILEKRPTTVAGPYVNTNGWSWGTSHSFEQRLVYDGNYFHCLAKGDGYPRGISYDKVLGNLNASAEVIDSKTGKDNLFPIRGEIGENVVPLGLGGFLTSDEGLVATFITNENRGTYDVGFLSLDPTNQVTIKWLTSTSNADENSSYMAHYGNHFLVTWTSLDLKQTSPETAQDTFMAAVVDKKGNFIIQPFELNARFPRRKILKEFKWDSYRQSFGDSYTITGDFINFSNGDIGWVNVTESNEIEVVRILVK